MRDLAARLPGPVSYEAAADARAAVLHRVERPPHVGQVREHARARHRVVGELRARARLLYVVSIVIFLGLLARLAYLQIVEGERSN